ncbi:MAG: hypothetical protein ACK2T5_06805 [Anaerolineales bacterium]|jgi:hypothetical protein
MDIGLLNEKPLHAALKNWVAQPENQVEVAVDGFVIDIIQDGVLVEIQTGNFSAIRRKVKRLTENHVVQLVYPIAFEKWIIKPGEGSEKESRRKSPKRGQVVEVFKELVSFPELLQHPNFSLEVLLIREEEIRRYSGKQGWRRGGWVTEERRLLEVVESHVFRDADDLWTLIPTGLPDQFTTSDLAHSMQIPRRLAQQVAYCLRKASVIEPIGKRGRANLYARSENSQ